MSGGGCIKGLFIKEGVLQSAYYSVCVCIKGCVISYLVRAGSGSASKDAAGGREVSSRTQCTWSGCIASGLTGVLIQGQLTGRQNRECRDVIGRNVGTRLNEETLNGGVNPISH